jgi:hypothetical protein
MLLAQHPNDKNRRVHPRSDAPFSRLFLEQILLG